MYDAEFAALLVRAEGAAVYGALASGDIAHASECAIEADRAADGAMALADSDESAASNFDARKARVSADTALGAVCEALAGV